MSVLLVDAGNSRIKWATLQNLAEGQQSCACEWRQQAFEQCFEQKLPPVVSAAWVSSVAGEPVDGRLSQWFQERYDIAPVFARTKESFAGITNGYDQSEQLGVDRWLAMAAAWRQMQAGQALCLVDCGTAITVDVVQSDGKHLGGLIIPGLALMRQSLLQAPGVSFQGDFDVNLLGRNTSDGVNNGTLNAVTAFLQNTVLKIEQKLRQPLQILLTGGAGLEIKRHLPESFHYEADLVLKGLALLANQTNE